MIWESWYWKDDLLKTAKRLSKRKTQKRWHEKTFVSLEKDMFISFYAIRKLIEAKKLSNSLVAFPIPVMSYPSMGKAVTYKNWDRVDELYDLKVRRKLTLALNVLCNQIIHSYVFSLSFGRKGNLNGFLFCSDWQRNKCLYKISLLETIKILKQVGSNYPSEMHLQYDPGKKDYVITSK